MAKHATTPGGSSVPAAARPFSHAPPTKSKCTWDPWTHLTNLCQPTKAGSSVASPGCRRFRSRDDTSAIVTPRVALRSRSHERCEGAATSDRDVLRPEDWWLAEPTLGASRRGTDRFSMRDVVGRAPP